MTLLQALNSRHRAYAQPEPITSTARANCCDAGYYTESCKPAEDEYTLSFWEVVDNTNRADPYPPILRTCQKLRQEGLPLFYEENTLEILWTPGSVRLPAELTRYCCDILDGSRTFKMDLSGFQTGGDEWDTGFVPIMLNNFDDVNLQYHHEIPHLNHQAQR